MIRCLENEQTGCSISSFIQFIHQETSLSLRSVFFFSTFSTFLRGASEVIMPNCAIWVTLTTHAHLTTWTWPTLTASRRKASSGHGSLAVNLQPHQSRAANTAGAMCDTKPSGGFTPPSVSPRFREAFERSGDHVASEHSHKGAGGPRGSMGVKATWLFKKWQRELLILCTRTERAAAVTFNGIIDCFGSATAGFRLLRERKSWTEEPRRHYFHAF